MVLVATMIDDLISLLNDNYKTLKWEYKYYQFHMKETLITYVNGYIISLNNYSLDKKTCMEINSIMFVHDSLFDLFHKVKNHTCNEINLDSITNLLKEKIETMKKLDQAELP
jgi:hypothetical protein